MICQEFNLRNAHIRFLLRDPKSVMDNKKFKKVSISTSKISKKVQRNNIKLSNPTYRRKLVGARKLYGQNWLKKNKINKN